MCAEIYGIDDSAEITPLMVRDAIVECFRQAHCTDSGVDAGDKDVNKQYCYEIVKKAFVDAGADFDNPSKLEILKVMDNLAEFSKKFRDQGVIHKHYEEIMKLINKLAS